MAQENAVEGYRGVLCVECEQPIPLPPIVAELEAQSRQSGDETARSGRVYTLRCRVCDKEYLYQAADIRDFEGTPKVRQKRSVARAGGHGMHNLSKAANY
jgi:hypothetical protein